MFLLFDILKAVFVRCLLVLHALVAIWRVTDSYKNNLYWILACILVLLFAESLYTVIKRRGKEYQRFMPAFFCYLCTMLTCIWLLELDKTEKFIEGQQDALDQSTNSTEMANLPPVTPNTWIMLVEEMLPYFLFISRWILPRGRVKREQLAELLFAFIGIGGDIMEYFSLLGEDKVRPNKELCYVVLAIWSFSILQFTMTITVIHQPKRQRNINVIVDTVDASASKKRQKFRHEVMAIFLTMIMQDLPFMIVRLYVMIAFDVVNYSLIFFTSKNVMIISLLFYKLAIICCNYYSPKKSGEEESDDDDDDDDEDDEEGGVKKKRPKIAGDNSSHKSGLTNHVYESETPSNHVGGNSTIVLKSKNKKAKTKGKSDIFNISNSNTLPNGKLKFSENGLEVSPYLIENPSFQLPPSKGAISLTTRATNTSPHMLRAALRGFIEIEHPGGDESQDTGFTSDNQDKSASRPVSQRSSDDSQF